MRLLIILNFLVAADAYDSVFQQGIAHLDTKQYLEAAQSFEQLVGEGVVSAPLFYNLALAYHKSGEKGAALANYERALRLEPNLVAVQDNHKMLLAELERQQAPPLPPAWQEALLFWHSGLGYSTVLWTAALSWCAFWILLVVRKFRPVPYFSFGAAGFCIVAIFCGLSAWVKAHPLPLAVSVSSATPVYYGVNDTGAVRFELFEGERVKVVDRRENWMRIESAGGEEGWIQGVKLIEVGPPYKMWQPQKDIDNTALSQQSEAMITGV